MAEVSGTRRRSADIRSAMIDAAERIVSEEGVSAVTARRVASEVGVAVGTTYNVFDNLGALIAAVNARTFAALAETMSEVKVEGRATREVLLDFADRYADFVHRNERRWLAVFETEMPADGAEPPNQPTVDRLFATLERAIRAHDRRIDDKLASQSARGLWAAVHGLLILSAAGRLGAIRLDSVRPTIEHLVQCHLAGLEDLVKRRKDGDQLPMF
ncbi:WHG domain-containing protein [Afifella sp. H1R]|uniref:TetR/AcrR family transcriptional regulator n=1 Tax=Afifella sp. H1R TaxID=2908841 RepID=UPI001F24105F|nr:WHG domain-containing protein [Afifella sp. H1R]MCF1503412.1 WHG domain-containing protein [Afifella sp. H1R]